MNKWLTLRKGSSGGKVRYIQGLLHIKQDGSYGKNTFDAVVSFQKRYNLHIDGAVGPVTFMALQKHAASKAYVDIKPIKKTTIDTSKVNTIVNPLLGTIFRNNKRNREMLTTGFNELLPYLDLLELNNKNKLVLWGSQLREELGANITVIENGNYSASALPKLFSYYKKHRSLATLHGRTSSHPAHQEKIFNCAYANRYRNGNVASGDGNMYRGRGSKMVTFSANYKQLDDFVRKYMPELYQRGFRPLSNPESLADPRFFLISGATFWKINKCYVHTNVISVANCNRITKIVNKYTGSYDKRVKHMKVLLRCYA